MPENYRREGDQDTRLLITLNERVGNIQEALKERLESCEEDIKETRKIQINNPCKTHDLRLRYLERLIWGMSGAIALLVVEMIISIFKT